MKAEKTKCSKDRGCSDQNTYMFSILIVDIVTCCVYSSDEVCQFTPKSSDYRI